MPRLDRVRVVVRHGRAAAAIMAAAMLCGMAASDHPGNAILGNETDGTNWPAFGRTFSEQHYSPLEQVNQVNVARLGLAWFFDLPVSVNAFSTPLEVDGTLFFTEGQSIIHALDARTGRELWSYDPEVAKVAGDKLKAVWGVRGIAWWGGNVYSGTQDGRLIALDGKTGKVVYSVQTTDPKQPFQSSDSAPRCRHTLRTEVGNRRPRAQSGKSATRQWPGGNRRRGDDW